MFLDPRVEPLPGYAFRDINEMVGLASEIKNLGHIDVIKSLGATRLLVELLPHRWIDAFDRDEFQGNGFAGSFVDSLVSNSRTGRAKFARGAVAVNTDPIVLEESCLFHIVSWSAARAKTIRSLLIPFNLTFGHELLILNPGTASRKFGADETSSPAYELVMSTIVRDQETVDERQKTLRS